MINGRPASAGKAAPKRRIWRRCGQFLIRDDEVFDLACQPADDAWDEVVGRQNFNVLWTCFEPKFVRPQFHQNQVILSGLFLASHSAAQADICQGGKAMEAVGGVWSCDFVSQAGMGRCGSDAIFQPNLAAGAGRRWIFLCTGLHRLELSCNTSPATSK